MSRPAFAGNAVILHAEGGRSLRLFPGNDDTLLLEVDGIGQIIRNNLDRAAVALVHDYLAAWLDAQR